MRAFISVFDFNFPRRTANSELFTTSPRLLSPCRAKPYARRNRLNHRFPRTHAMLVNNELDSRLHANLQPLSLQELVASNRCVTP